MSPELPVQRSARERFVKACIKLGLPLNPRKRLVHAGLGFQCWAAIQMEGSVSFASNAKKSWNIAAKMVIFF